MIPGARFCRSPRQNLLIISVDNDLINASLRVFTKNSSCLIRISWTLLPITGLSPTCIALSADNNLIKQFMQVYLAIKTKTLIAGPGLATSPDAGP